MNHRPSQQISKEEYKSWKMRCYCKILHITYKDHVTNEEVHAKIQQAVGPHEDLTIIKRLQWYGHVSHSSGLAKTILQGTVKGGRKQGRQRKRWEDNIREWTGLEFGQPQRAVENRKKWSNLVVKSSVVPQRPLRLRNRWCSLMTRDVSGNQIRQITFISVLESASSHHVVHQLTQYNMVIRLRTCGNAAQQETNFARLQ